MRSSLAETFRFACALVVARTAAKYLPGLDNEYLDLALDGVSLLSSGFLTFLLLGLFKKSHVQLVWTIDGATPPGDSTHLELTPPGGSPVSVHLAGRSSFLSRRWASGMLQDIRIALWFEGPPSLIWTRQHPTTVGQGIRENEFHFSLANGVTDSDLGYAELTVTQSAMGSTNHDHNVSVRARILGDRRLHRLAFLFVAVDEGIKHIQIRERRS